MKQTTRETIIAICKALTLLGVLVIVNVVLTGILTSANVTSKAIWLVLTGMNVAVIAWATFATLEDEW